LCFRWLLLLQCLHVRKSVDDSSENCLQLGLSPLRCVQKGRHISDRLFWTAFHRLKSKTNQTLALSLKALKIFPFFFIKILNPDIYSAINEMYLLQKLRIQFNFIRAFLFNCDKSQTIMDTFKKHLYARAYLYESIHQYSIADFDLIKTKSFEPLLTKNIQIGRDHILKCSLCSQKGFICEICQNSEVLYPFDVDTTFRVSLFYKK
jgi:hypothetical protein